ncbi:hypothetical protein DFH09DRAFT_1300410 [Mycena vulgaris]|nr:hypothetical protein DFH09DRAFT_1300410 [Mycena vulgaris]
MYHSVSRASPNQRARAISNSTSAARDLPPYEISSTSFQTRPFTPSDRPAYEIARVSSLFRKNVLALFQTRERNVFTSPDRLLYEIVRVDGLSSDWLQTHGERPRGACKSTRRKFIVPFAVFAMSSLPSTPSTRSQSMYNTFCRLKQFAATAAVLQAHGWGREGPAKYAYVVVVGRVRDHRCFVGPVGAYNPRFGDGLEKAKYSFILECPSDDPLYKAAWKQSITNLKVLERDACGTNTANFFVDEPGEVDTALRFTKFVFEARGDNPPDVDTSRWPVGVQHMDRLKDLCQTHDARPFPLYDEKDVLVPTSQVERFLPGCLVATTFRMIYHGFTRDGRNVDSMTGEVVQVETIKRGRPRPRTPFTRQAIFRPAPSLDANGNLPGALAPASPLPAATTQFSPFAAPPPITHVPHGTVGATPVAPPSAVSVLHTTTSSLAPPVTPPRVSFAPQPAPGLSPYEAQQYQYMPRSFIPANAHVAGPTTPVQDLPAQPVTPPPAPFAPHLNPETSPYGAHQFQFAHPGALPPATTTLEPSPFAPAFQGRSSTHFIAGSSPISDVSPSSGSSAWKTQGLTGGGSSLAQPAHSVLPDLHPSSPAQRLRAPTPSITPPIQNPPVFDEAIMQSSAEGLRRPSNVMWAGPYYSAPAQMPMGSPRPHTPAFAFGTPGSSDLDQYVLHAPSPTDDGDDYDNDPPEGTVNSLKRGREDQDTEIGQAARKKSKGVDGNFETVAS